MLLEHSISPAVLFFVYDEHFKELGCVTGLTRKSHLRDKMFAKESLKYFFLRKKTHRITTDNQAIN